MSGVEKRIKKRTDLNTKLTLSIIEVQNGREMDPFEVKILNVSSNGIGFSCDSQLMIGEMFKGVLTIWTKQKMDVILKIVRSKVEDVGYSYGAAFVGLETNDTNRIEFYQMLKEYE